MKKIASYFKHQWSIAEWSAAALLLGMTSLLWLKGYPSPQADDLFFLGAGISLASGHGLTNPYIQPWLDFFGTQSFLLQPPGHAYLTSLWLRLFGISEMSVRVFQWVVLMSGAYFFCLYLRQFVINRSIRLLAGLAYLLAFQRDGLRPDVTAFMLMFAGIALLPTRSMPIRFIAWLILGFSALCYPITIFAAPALIIGQWWPYNRLEQAVWVKTIKSHVIPLVTAVLGTLLLLHWMIEGHWQEFSYCLMITKGISTPGIGLPNLEWHWISITNNSQVFITLPLYASALIVTILAWTWRSQYDSQQRIILTTLMICVLLTAAGSPLAALHFCKVLCLIITAIGFVGSGLLPRKACLPVLAVMIALSQPYFLLGIPFQAIPSRADYEKIRSAAEREMTAGKRLIIDEVSARFVFDYRLPEGALDATCFKTDYLFSRIDDPRMHAIDRSKVGRTPSQKLSFSAKPENDVWVISEARALWTVDDFPKEGQSIWPVVTLFDKRFGTVPIAPFKVIIVK